MKQIDRGLAAARLFTVTVVAAMPLAAQAQAGEDKLQWGATIYGWFPAIGGSSSFPTVTGGASIDVSSQQVIDALKMAFMGSLEAKKGRWGLWTDLVYADFGASKSGTRQLEVGGHPLPVNVTGDLQLDVKSWIWTTAGTYSLASSPAGTMDLLGGARMLDLEQTLSWSLTGDISGLPLPGRSGTARLSGTNWDAVVGVKGRANLGSDGKWFIPYYLDIGTGESQFTWQGIAGIGYQFSWGSLIAAWRYMDYDFKSSSKVDTMTFNGGAIGVNFKW